MPHNADMAVASPQSGSRPAATRPAWAKVHQKGRRSAIPRPTTLPNFITLRLPTVEISLTKNLAHGQTDTETVNDISRTAYRHCGVVIKKTDR